MFIENKGIAVFLVCFTFALVAVVKLLMEMAANVYIALSVHKTEQPRKFCRMSSSWLWLLLSCSTIIFVLSL